MKRSIPETPLSPVPKSPRSNTPKISSPLRNPPISLSNSASPTRSSKRSKTEPGTPVDESNKDSQSLGILRQTKDSDRRKSFNRRVSFAATARLRHFETDQGLPDSSNKEPSSPQTSSQNSELEDNKEPWIQSFQHKTSVPQFHLKKEPLDPSPTMTPTSFSIETPTLTLPPTQPTALTLTVTSTPDPKHPDSNAEESQGSIEVPVKEETKDSSLEDSDGSVLGSPFSMSSITTNQSFSRNPSYDPFSSISPIDSFQKHSSYLSQFHTPSTLSFTSFSSSLHSTPSDAIDFRLATPTPMMKQLPLVEASLLVTSTPPPPPPAPFSSSASSSFLTPLQATEKHPHEIEENEDPTALTFVEKYLTAEAIVSNSEAEPQPNPPTTFAKPFHPSSFENQTIESDPHPQTTLDSSQVLSKPEELNLTLPSTSEISSTPSIDTSTSTHLQGPSTPNTSGMKFPFPQLLDDTDSSTPQQISSIFSLYTTATPSSSSPPLPSKDVSNALFNEPSSSQSSKNLSPRLTMHTPTPTSTSSASILSNATSQVHTPSSSPKPLDLPPRTGSPVHVLMGVGRSMTSPSIAHMLRELDPLANYSQPSVTTELPSTMTPVTTTHSQAPTKLQVHPPSSSIQSPTNSTFPPKSLPSTPTLSTLSSASTTSHSLSPSSLQLKPTSPLLSSHSKSMSSTPSSSSSLSSSITPPSPPSNLLPTLTTPIKTSSPKSTMNNTSTPTNTIATTFKPSTTTPTHSLKNQNEVTVSTLTKESSDIHSTTSSTTLSTLTTMTNMTITNSTTTVNNNNSVDDENTETTTATTATLPDTTIQLFVSTISPSLETTTRPSPPKVNTESISSSLLPGTTHSKKPINEPTIVPSTDSKPMIMPPLLPSPFISRTLTPKHTSLTKSSFSISSPATLPPFHTTTPSSSATTTTTTPFKEPPRTPSFLDRSTSSRLSMKGTPLTILKQTPPIKSGMGSNTTAFLTTPLGFSSMTPSTPYHHQIEYQPPTTPITGRVKRMIAGASWQESHSLADVSPASSISWLDDVDNSTDLRKERMPFHQELEKEVTLPTSTTPSLNVPKTLMDVFQLAEVRFFDDIIITPLPLRPELNQHLFSAVTATWPFLALRYRSCRQMMEYMTVYTDEIQSLLTTSMHCRVLKECQEHRHHPLLQGHLIDQIQLVVTWAQLRAKLFIKSWWMEQLKELKTVFQVTLEQIKKDDVLLTEKLQSLGTLHELVEEKVEKNNELYRKEKAEYDDELRQYTQKAQTLQKERDRLQQLKLQLTDLIETKKKEIQEKKARLQDLTSSVDELNLEVTQFQSKMETLQYYTVEDYNRYKKEYDLISKITGWTVLLGLKRKGRESWLVYEDLIGFSYLNTLKVYFQVEHGIWTLARTEAHDTSLPLIVELVDFFPERLPLSEQELSKAVRWMAHRWDWLLQLNHQLFESMPKYWVTYKYDDQSHKLKLTHNCYLAKRVRVNVHFYLDVWKSSLVYTPPLEYEVEQPIFGHVPLDTLNQAIQEAYEQKDIRAFFAANMKVLEEAN